MKQAPFKDKTTWQALTIGIEISISITAGLALGWYGDQYFDTFPILFIFGLFSGIGAAIKAIMRLIKLDQKANPPKDNT